MRVLRALLIAFLTSATGCVLAAFAGEYLTRLYHVSDFEGQRGYAVIFLCAPLGLVAGFLIGLIVALRSRRLGFVGFLIAQGMSLLLICIFAVVVAGLLYLAADKPPTIDGKQLTLDFELKVPPAIQVSVVNSQNIHASLYANNRDNRMATLNFNAIEKRDGWVVIPGTAALMSHSTNRSLLASIEPEPKGTQFIQLNLPAGPRKENESWSEWIPATQHGDLSPVPEQERIQMRYRVRPVDEPL